MLQIPASQDMFDYVVDYVNEIKPYHTKIIDVSVTFNIREQLKVNINDYHKLVADFFFDQRHYKKGPYENQFFEEFGMDLYNGQAVGDLPLGRFGYDRSKYDHKFDQMGIYTIPKSNHIPRGIDEYPIDGTGLDDRNWFIALDDIGLDLAPFEEPIKMDYGFDDHLFDINSFDDIYIDEFEYNEGLQFVGYKSTSLGLRYNTDEQPIDHEEYSSPTTIKANFKEKLVIDKSRAMPVGFDKSNFALDWFDTIPSNIISLLPTGYDTNPIKYYDMDTFDSTVNIKPVDPKTRTFEKRNVCDLFFTKTPLEFKNLPNLDTITSDQLKLLTKDQLIGLLSNPNMNSSFLTKFDFSRLYEFTSNDITGLPDSIIKLLFANINENDTINLLNKLSNYQLSAVDSTILNNLTKEQLIVANNNVFEYILDNANDLLSLLLKTPSNKSALTVDQFANIPDAGILGLNEDDLKKLFNLSQEIDYNWGTRLDSFPVSIKNTLISTTDYKPTILPSYGIFEQELIIMGTTGGDLSQSMKFFYNGIDYSKKVEYDGANWKVILIGFEVGTYPTKVQIGNNIAESNVIVNPYPPVVLSGEIDPFILDTGTGAIGAIRMHLCWARYENNMDIVNNLTLKYQIKKPDNTYEVERWHYDLDQDRGIYSIPTRNEETAGTNSAFDDQMGLAQMNNSFVIISNSGNGYKTINKIVTADNLLEYGESIMIDHKLSKTNIEEVSFYVSALQGNKTSNISDYHTIALVITEYDKDGVPKQPKVYDFKDYFGTQSIGMGLSIVKLKKVGNYWRIMPMI